MTVIATWNVNSINARLEGVLAWFESETPDVAVLQEIKCVDEKFPTEAFERLGYNVVVHGQKTYNGVALLSKFPIEDVRKGLPGLSEDEVDEQVVAAGIGPAPGAIESAWRQTVEARLRAATLTFPEDEWQAGGGRAGRHTEHLGRMLAEMQVLQRRDPGLSW